MDNDQAIKTIDLKQAKEMRLFVFYEDGKVDQVGTTHLKKLFEHIESLSQEAEIGRSTTDTLSKLPPCKGKFDSAPCTYIREISSNKGCHLESVYRLRSEIDRLQRKGAE